MDHWLRQPLIWTVALAVHGLHFVAEVMAGRRMALCLRVLSVPVTLTQSYLLVVIILVGWDAVVVLVLWLVVLRVSIKGIVKIIPEEERRLICLVSAKSIDKK